MPFKRGPAVSRATSIPRGPACATTPAGRSLPANSLQQTRRLIPEGLTNRVGPFAAVGADLKVLNTTTNGTPRKNSTGVPQGSLYLELDPLKYLSLYLDQDFANGVNREAFIFAHDESPATVYLKAGRMGLPYGLRIDDFDQTAPIRANLNMTFAQQDIGLEAGWMPGPFEIITAISNGAPGTPADENLSKASTSTVNWIGKNGRVGASFQWNRRLITELIQGGLHGGFKIQRLTWLGEVDLQKSSPVSGAATTTTLVGYSELAWRAVDGLYAITNYDYLDPNRNVTGDLTHRIGLGLDLYPIPLCHLSLLYRINTAPGAASNDQLFARFHAYF